MRVGGAKSPSRVIPRERGVVLGRSPVTVAALIAARAHGLPECVQQALGVLVGVAVCRFVPGSQAVVTVLAVRLFYVDDSGNETVTTFSAVSMPVQAWAVALDAWLGWRHHLHLAHGIDVRSRLHATDWLAGRGRPSSDPAAAINRSKPVRWKEFVSALDAVAVMPGMEIMTTFVRGGYRKPAYRALMGWIDRRLREADDYGLIVVDGESGELRTMHRELDIATRRVVEDPWMRDARESQWPQVADFVAHTAFQAIVRTPSRAFIWEWYEQRLGAVIVRDERGRHGVQGLR
jgi:hypothetical protein